MSTFSKLSLLAQYDDMCRLVNKLIKDSADEEDASISMLEDVQKRWYAREATHEREKEELRGEITTLQREIKKLNRQLAESRNALQREMEEKKRFAREGKSLQEQIRQARLLLDSKDAPSNPDAHRKRVIKCLDIERLSPIQSDDSDDNVSGLDYDRTEEEIVEAERSRRSNIFADALADIASSEQPTLLYRYYDKGNEKPTSEAAPRRSSRRSGSNHMRASHVASTQTLPNINKEKFEDTPAETDSNDMESDDNGIEYARQQLQKYEAEKREKLASAISTPSMKLNKAATLSAKSSASMKSIANVPRPQEHKFARKKSFIPESCGPCGGKISFYGSVSKCENCGVISHPECQDKCPLPCVKITAPTARSRAKKILISDYVNSDAELKVPALIVHCCNEIEKDYNIETSGLYRVVAHTSAIEELQQKILKSKSGMPNLSKVDVHLLTGVVKRFLQGLDESLITTTIWSRIAEAIKSYTDLEARTRMTYFIEEDLPPANRHTLAYLMQHLHAIAKHSDKNMMTTKALAKTLAPTIVGNSCRNPPPQTIQKESKTQIQIMEALFDISEEFWSEHAPKTTPSPQTDSLGSRLLAATPSRTEPKTTRSSRVGATLPTPKLKPFFS